MSKEERQLLINKLSFIGYYAEAENKDSVFLAIAAVYSLSDKNIEIIKQHAEEVANNQTAWNRELILEII
jgi:hypothetical protein